jgi:GNAT superfamily N-acetyltransferase
MLYRQATSDDIDELKYILWLASNWNQPAKSFPSPFPKGLSQYLPNLVARDKGILATTQNGRVIGGCWYTLPTPRWHGYGYIADNIPEITIAVHSKYRRQRIGDELLTRLITIAKQEQLVALSLSCSTENGAIDLYEQHGFVIDSLNDTSWTMLCPLFRYEDD